MAPQNTSSIRAPRTRSEEEAQLLQAIAASLGEPIDEEKLERSRQAARQSYQRSLRTLTPPNSPGTAHHHKYALPDTVVPRGEFC